MSMDIHPSTPMVGTQQLETNYTKTFNPNTGKGEEKLLELLIHHSKGTSAKGMEQGWGQSSSRSFGCLLFL